MAFLTTITNPFDPINSREIKDIEHGKPIYSVVAGFYIYRDVVVSVNGQIIHDYEYIIQEDDHVGFLAVPEKGGKNILGMVAMIALTIAAPYAVGAMMGVAGTSLGVGAGLAIGGLSGAMIVGANLGIMMLGGMLINSLLGPSMPSNSPTQSIESSPTYGWDNVQNQSAEGIALPIVYGKTRITPPIISQYVETVNNKQYLNILYALNDGEIASVSDVMINDNPVTYYNDVVVETRLGTNTQTLIPSFDNTRVDTGVGAKLSTTETIRQTSYNNVTGLKITVSAPSGIYYANDKGGLDSRTVGLVVKYRIVGYPTWTTIANTSISGATTSTLRVNFSADNIPSGQYEISIARTTAESTSTRTSDKVYFEGFTEVVYDDFTYPTTALMAIRALATDQLSGNMPKVSCVVDRGFGTSNPSVTAQNILSLVGADINQSLFDSWATWCDTENFKCNIIFDSEINVREALNIVGMLGRANIIQMGSTYLPIIERAESLPVQRFLFTMGNIIRDSFREDYLPLADRSNAVEVTYFDETLDYEKQSVEIYQHGYDESVDTTRKASVTLYGCTDRVQAVRHGRFLMNRNRFLTNTVSFEADVDAIACTIGDIIDVSHDVPQWGYSGRVLDEAMAHKVNLLAYSEQFESSSWTKGKTTITSGFLDPFGGNNARYVDETTIAGSSYFYKPSFALLAGLTYTASIFIKKAEDQIAYFWFSNAFFTDNVQRHLRYDFSTNQVIDLYSNFDSVGVQTLGDGWYRIYAKFTPDKSSSASAMVTGSLDETTTTGSGMYFFGAQLEIGELSEYTPTNTQWCYTQSTLVNGATATTSNTNVIQIDREVSLVGGVEYGFAMRLHDDTKVTVSIKPTYDVTTDIIPVPNTLDVSKFDIYAFGETDRVTKLFRVISISRSSDQRRKISAIEYIPQVYDDMSDNISAPNLSSLSTVSYLLMTTDTEVSTDGRSINIINLLWNGQAVAWDVYGREMASDTWLLLGNTQNPYFQIKDVMAGSYSYKVGDKVVSSSITIARVPLADVTGLLSFYQNNQMVLKWDAIIDDYRSPIYYEIRRGVSWLNSEVLGRTTDTRLIIDDAGTYFVKAVYRALDGVETWSENEEVIVISSANILRNVVATWDEYATSWSGTKTNLVVDGANLNLPAGIASGTYDIPTSHIVELSTAQLCRISMRYSASGGDDSIMWDSITDFDLWANVDGDVTGSWFVRPKLSISQDGTTWGAWQDFVMGDYVGKAFKARLEAISNDANITIVIDGFSFTVDMPDRIDKGDFVTSTGGTSFTYTYPFQTKPNCQITIVNATAGDDVKLTAESASGFTVQVLNGGVGVARTINYLSQGY